MIRRQLLTMGATLGLGLVAAGAAQAQPPAQPAAPPRRQVKKRMAKTTNLFKAPPGYPNCMDGTPEGVWVAEQKMSGSLSVQYKVPEPTDLSERCWLLDWNTGKILKTVVTQSRNTSGMAYGDGYIWMCANNSPVNGVFQTDMNSKTVSHRQIPLGPKDNGGGAHGAFYREGKLWLMSNRLRGILRVDAKTWAPEFMIPVASPRFHDICWDDGTIWLVTGENSTGYANGKQGLLRYNAATGEVLEEVEFAPGSADPHGLTMHNGQLYSCDAGIHPGWKADDSPNTGQIFRIDFI